MVIFRGPFSRPIDTTHEIVDRIKSETIEKSITDKSLLQFNLTKDKNSKRKAKCNLYFETSDIIPMTKGLLSRIQNQIKYLSVINDIIDNNSLKDSEKLKEISKIVKSI